MTTIAQPAFGEQQATALLAAGWRQGQVFRPCEQVPCERGCEDVFFVVCTQSCNVVSPDLVRDPLVELAVGRPVAKFNAKSHQARGKDVRKYHLQVAGAEFPALEVDINSRRFIRRELLLAIDHAGFVMGPKEIRNFAGWIARSYTRITLPNELVARMKKTLLPKLNDCLAEKLGNPATPRHNRVASMWIKWEPNHELAPGTDYQVTLMILCDDPETSEEFDRSLHAVIGDAQCKMDGVIFGFDVSSPSETLLSDLDGWQRFTEWDYLTGMGETAAMGVV